MPRLQPPNALLFLITLFRPQLLRPDIRVPNIGHVDFRALRKIGFSGVVVDKDNCITLPEKDRVHPPLASAWSDLLSAFDPGRVLIVSNSAGTKKDPGGLAAESVAYHLRTPVLAHSTPKPACSDLVLQYFRGQLPPPPTTLAGDIKERYRHLAQEEWDDKDAFVRRFTPLAEGKILGESKREKGGGVGGLDLIDPIRVPEKEDESAVEGSHAEKGRKEVDAARDSVKIEAGQVETTTSTTKTQTSTSASTDARDLPRSTAIEPVDPLRLLVIGDRLFTDTLLAARLRASLGQDNVVSIQTTLLPDPSDVRLLRWVENRLSRGKLREGKEDWGRFVLRDDAAEEAAARAKAELGLGWRRFIPFRRQWVAAPELGWRPATWSFWGAVRGSTRGLGIFGRTLGKGANWAWLKGKKWVRVRREAREARVAAAAGAAPKLVEAGGSTAVGDIANTVSGARGADSI